MRQNSKPEPPAKPKPGTPLNAKALDAWHAELRRYERRLVQWEADLEMRECDLDTAITENWAEDCDPYDGEEEEACECCVKDAVEGCECENCESWRVEHPQRLRDLGGAKVAVPAVGDEVAFLDRLFELKDKRKQ